MISRLLVISLLSLGFFTTTTRAIATSSAPEAIASVNQSDLKPDVQPLPMSNVASHPFVWGVLAICLLGTPVLGYAVYKQHLSYRKAIQRNQIESLERIWRLPSKIR